MSIETQIAALVTAANNLTGAVNGKMSEIDVKVDAATTELENKFNTLARRTYWVDGLNGLDTNDGLASNRPVKTLAKVYDLIKLTAAATVVINIVRPGTYVFPADATGSAATRSIAIYAYETNGVTRVYPGGLNVTLRAEGNYVTFNTSTEIWHCNIEVATTEHGFLFGDSFKLRTYKCKVIKASAISYFLGNYSNPAGLNFSTFQETTFDGGGAVFNPVGKLQGTTMWKQVAVTLQNGAALHASYTSLADLYVY